MKRAVFELTDRIMEALDGSDANTVTAALRIVDILLQHKSSSDIDIRLDMASLLES